MRKAHSENPVAGVVTFTNRGDAALDQLVNNVASGCDGSPESILETIGQLMVADIGELVEALNETDRRRLSGNRLRQVTDLLW